MNNHHQDMFYEQSSARSPGSRRNQQQGIHRQTSRHFDMYGQVPNPMYGQEEPHQRYEPTLFDRLGPNTLTNENYGHAANGPQTWNPSAFTNPQQYGGFAATGRLKAGARGRGSLPVVSSTPSATLCCTIAHSGQTWLDQPNLPMGGNNAYGAMGPPPLGAYQHRNDNFVQEQDEELIPTAIVIKNIPFAIKKEQLIDLMTQMSLPLPYAFNYHFDNGVFRGLAFANFTSADETAAVIDNLNHFELQGRKLRVEYKKMLPIQERERIEREKRERRGQLEEQHRPMVAPALQNQHSMSSIGSHIAAASPSPVSARNNQPGNGYAGANGPYPPAELDVNLNDPQTLQFFSQLLLFKDDHSREALIFPSSLTPSQRRTVHTLAHQMQLSHVSRGNGDQRQVHVLHATGQNVSPPLPQGPGLNDNARRPLQRPGAGDFPDAYTSLRGQGSNSLLGVTDSSVNGSGLSASHAAAAQNSNLRAARSVADLRSYTPSPVPSSASFPAALQSNMARFPGDHGPASGASTTTPTLTPTASGNALGPQQQHSADGLLANGLGGLSIGSSIAPPTGGSPRRLRGMFSWDEGTGIGPSALHAGPGSHHGNHAGTIGSHRPFGMSSMASFDGLSTRDPGAAGLPLRQPRGPAIERTPGFPRHRSSGHQGRGSDELRQPQPEIIVE